MTYEIIPLHKSANDLTGRTYGHLIAIAPVGHAKCRNIKWLCICVCGSETVVVSPALSGGRSTRCGHGCVSRIGLRRDKFWRQVVKTDGCWTWTGCLSSGYGQLWHGSAMVGAHVYSWEIHNSPVPDGMFVCHHCDNPKCVNPNHLFVGTAMDNITDMVSKGRQARGEKAGGSKLTREDVLEIRALSKTIPNARIARMFNVTRANIGYIVKNATWRHV